MRKTQYKHSGTFANRKYEKLSYLEKPENLQPHCSTSVEIVNPIVKMRPHPAVHPH